MTAIGQQFLDLLKMAIAISIDDGRPQVSWQTAKITGQPDNEVLSLSWTEGETRFSTILTEQGINDGVFFSDGRFVADDFKGESVLIRLFALHPLTTEHLPKGNDTPTGATESAPIILSHSVTAHHLADLIRAAGIPTQLVTEPDETEDGAIHINASVHVQVGFSGCSVVIELPGSEFLFMEESKTLGNLMTDIRAGIERARTATKVASRPKP